MTATAPALLADSIATPEELRRYAEAIVLDCLVMAEGETLYIEAEPAHRELVVAVAEVAHRRGIDVDCLYADPLLRRARIEHGPDEHLGRVPDWLLRRRRSAVGPHAGFLGIGGSELPDAFGGLAPERIGADVAGRLKAQRPFSKALLENRLRWSLCVWPTDRWADQVYPELPPAEGKRRLLEDILYFCRLAPDDPPEAWKQHLDTLVQRAARLDGLQLRALELRGPGTDLRIGLAPGTRFVTGTDTTVYGQRVCVNFPTEEVYTTPDAAASEGTFRCSKPLSFHGRTITGLAGEFRGGRLVRLEADDASDRDTLLAVLDTDRGGRRLGEVALVDSSSRIGRTGRTYWHTGLDENLASHIAFGAGFPVARTPDPSARGRRGVNDSAIHIDVMVGSDELEIAGMRDGGGRVPLIAGGCWQV
jgi:aminopeptidase